MNITKGILGFVKGFPKTAVAIPFLIIFFIVAIGVYKGGSAIHDLLGENKKLKQSLTNLTDAGKLGYAKVVSQITDEQGNVVATTLKFVGTDRDDELKIVLEKKYKIEGDIVHFDALIVKFGDKMVMEGKKKSLYLWRRIYGENMPPSAGFAIEEAGKEPKRYHKLLDEIGVKKSKLFWESIWDLANDPQKLKKYDIEAVFGNATYTKLRKGLLYIFRISPTGQIYQEVIPDI